MGGRVPSRAARDVFEQVLTAHEPDFKLAGDGSRLAQRVGGRVSGRGTQGRVAPRAAPAAVLSGLAGFERLEADITATAAGRSRT